MCNDEAKINKTSRFDSMCGITRKNFKKISKDTQQTFHTSAADVMCG